MTLGIELNKFNNLNDYLKDNRRSYNTALKNNLIFKIDDYNEENLKIFLPIYNSTMDNLSSSNYYYFDVDYYNALSYLKGSIFFANIYMKDIVIASCIIFKYKNLLHYHLGGSLLEHRKLRPNNFLHCKIIEYGINNGFKLYHLGGGLKDNDALFDFKKKISTREYKYTIYKNIINDKVYDKLCEQYQNNDYFPKHRM